MAWKKHITIPTPAQIETWKTVPCFPHLAASSLGNIRGPKGLALRQYIGKDKSCRVSIYQSGKTRTLSVPKLVALAFIGPRPDGMEINHIDGDRSHNWPTNLEYVTHADNMIHARLTELWSKPKLNDLAVMLILELFQCGYSSKRIAVLLSMDPTTIRDIKRGATWKHIRRPR